MKKTITLTIIALTTLCFAQAEKEERKGPKKPPPHIIEKFDTDGDGKLDETERAAAKEARESKKSEEQGSDKKKKCKKCENCKD